jgi:hypothetical protein
MIMMSTVKNKFKSKLAARMKLKAAGKAITHFTPSDVDSWIMTSVFFWFLTLPTCVKIGFKALECRTISGLQWLTVDVERECWTGQHLVIALAVVTPMLIVYGCVVPFSAVLILRRGGPKRDDNPAVMYRWGAVFSGYSKDKYWWELVVILRKGKLCLPVAALICECSVLH